MGWPDSLTMGNANPNYLTEEIHTLDEVLTELEKHRENPSARYHWEPHLHWEQLADALAAANDHRVSRGSAQEQRS